MDEITKFPSAARFVPPKPAPRSDWPWLSVVVLVVAAGAGWFAHSRVASSPRSRRRHPLR